MMIQAHDYDLSTEKIPSKTLDLFPIYKEKLVSLVKLERPLKVVLDAANGATADFVKPLFEALGCEVTCLFNTPDGNFPNHEANPEEYANM